MSWKWPDLAALPCNLDFAFRTRDRLFYLSKVTMENKAGVLREPKGGAHMPLFLTDNMTNPDNRRQSFPKTGRRRDEEGRGREVERV